MKQSPLVYSLILALVYFLVSASYVGLSSYVLTPAFDSLEDIRLFETLKGISFIVVTSFILFAFSYWMFKRMNRYFSSYLESQQALLRSEKQAMRGLLTAALSHDFNNILTIVRLSMERLKDHSDLTPSMTTSLQKLDVGVNKLTALMDRFRNAQRRSLSDAPEAFLLAHVISESLEFIGIHPTVRTCHLEWTGATDDTLVFGQPILIHQILTNLVLNAAEATSGEGHILVELTRSNGHARISIHDNGTGIAEDLKPSVFEAFFTTKPQGTGLGLISVKLAAELNNGKVTLRDSHLGGACFAVELPIHSPVKKAL